GIMRMRMFATCLAVMGAAFSLAAASQPGKKGNAGNYSELGQLIQKMVAADFPKVYEQDTNWGKTIPMPDKLSLPRLRTRIKVGNRDELPHGMWNKIKAWVEDPNRDLTVGVRNFESGKQGSYRLTLEIDARMGGEMELQRWQKGLLLLNV